MGAISTGLGAATALGLVLLTLPAYAKAGAAVEDKSIRPFHIKIPEQALVDLRRRIAATKWPERETVTDASQGVQRATSALPSRLLKLN